MELEKVKELVEMMKANDLSELEVIDGQTRIALKRGMGGAVAPMMMTHGMMAPAPAMVVAGGPPKAAEADAESNLKPIKSPIVGTFYSAPSPTAQPFVKVGSKVNENAVVCIVEAMKVMNEVKAEINGTIRKILVENGAAIEFGQPLFLVEPD